MAALGVSLVTMADVAKSLNKQIGMVAEVLSQENAVLQDLPYMAMNMKTYHIEEIRSNLPGVYYRKANQPIPATKSTTEERQFNAAHFESKSVMDAKVAQRGGMDRVAYNRWNQGMGHVQAHAQEHAALFFYGSPASDPMKSPGLVDIYSTVDEAAEETANQVIDAGGTTGDNTSIYKLHFGERSIFGLYPEGTQAGLKRTDRSKGGQLVQIQGTDVDGNPGTFWGYEEDFEIDHGLCVKDYRQGSRICNIDPALLLSGVGAADLIDLMISADYKIHNPENGKGFWYVNRTIQAFLHKQALTKVGAGGGLSFDNYQGKRVLMFLDCPVRRCDALLSSEDRVV